MILFAVHRLFFTLSLPRLEMEPRESSVSKFLGEETRLESSWGGGSSLAVTLLKMLDDGVPGICISACYNVARSCSHSELFIALAAFIAIEKEHGQPTSRLRPLPMPKRSASVPAVRPSSGGSRLTKADGRKPLDKEYQ